MKPRTVKQQAQTQAYRDRQGSFAGSALPSTSWWCGHKTRQDFDEAVLRESERMNAPKQSQFRTHE